MTKRIFAASLALFLAAPSARAELVRPIRFPVDGPASFTDTFNDGRSGGRSHEGIDIMSAKMVPVDDVPDAFFINYKIGDVVTTAD